MCNDDNFMNNLLLKINMIILKIKDISTGAFYTISRYGRPAIEYQNHRYNLYVPHYSRVRGLVDNVRKKWRCVKWGTSNCRAGILTIDGIIVKVTNTHNH